MSIRNSAELAQKLLFIAKLREAFQFYGGPEGIPLLTNKYVTNIILRISFPLSFLQNTTLS